MADYQDPPIRFSVEGLRWMGEEFKPTGSSASFTLHGTDSGDGAEILRLLRKGLSKRLQVLYLGVGLDIEALDFEAPNAPTEADLVGVVEKLGRVLEAAQALRELAPEVIPDDEDDHGE